MWRILRDKSFKVYLIDEYRTSSLCPECSHDLKTFYYVDAPRSWRHRATDDKKTKYHSLLHCKDARCMDYAQSLLPRSYCIRYWNRGLGAVLSFQGIFISLIENGEIFQCFSRYRLTNGEAQQSQPTPKHSRGRLHKSNSMKPVALRYNGYSEPADEEQLLVAKRGRYESTTDRCAVAGYMQ
ncbi:hypothetical protein GGI25_003962 [Coemansia spiralis]|uniref:Transposase n=2 Tax=Coemansia TaxID=4863 RepID=A0A9W8KXU4_9FUNG|nr:hypothetical protein EDC05_003870 [Coemansia umbellata]KAJ2675455.1 hypothetical protein GGI25_003962 [Coemansia spiralis]